MSSPRIEFPDYYAILGVDQGASIATIKSRFRTLAKDNHPDKFPDLSTNEKEAKSENFVLIKEAYDCLIDPAQKAQLDQYLERKNAEKKHSESKAPQAESTASSSQTEEKVASHATRIPNYSRPSYGVPRSEIQWVKEGKNIREGITFRKTNSIGTPLTYQLCLEQSIKNPLKFIVTLYNADAKYFNFESIKAKLTAAGIKKGFFKDGDRQRGIEIGFKTTDLTTIQYFLNVLIYDADVCLTDKCKDKVFSLITKAMTSCWTIGLKYQN